MCIKELVPEQKLAIVVSEYHVGDCLLAAIYLYISYLYGKANDLLQFAWFFSCHDKKQDEFIIRLVALW